MTCRTAYGARERPYTFVTNEIPPQFGNPYETPVSNELIWRGDRDEHGKQVLVEHPWFVWEREHGAE